MTPDRYQKIQQVLTQRQPDLTVCMEEVHKPNNISAIIRTADAVGVHKIHAVWPKGSKMRTLGHTSAGARNWVSVQTHNKTVDAFKQLKEQGMQILVTNLPTLRSILEKWITQNRPRLYLVRRSLV